MMYWMRNSRPQKMNGDMSSVKLVFFDVLCMATFL